MTDGRMKKSSVSKTVGHITLVGHEIKMMHLDLDF